MPNWIGPWEIAIVVVVALLIFGPKRLPELGASIGKAIAGFKKGIKDSEQEIKNAVAEAKADKTEESRPAETTASTPPVERSDEI